MIVKGYNQVRVIYQAGESDNEIGNEAIMVHIDNGGTLILSQGSDTIVLNRGTLKEIAAAGKDSIASYEKSLSKRP